MQNLTTHLLTKNNQKTLPRCLESLPPDAKIIVGDLGSTDDTLQICRNYNVTIIQLSEGDNSKIRNGLVDSSDTDWQLYIEPWEYIESGTEYLNWAINQEETVYNLYIMQKDVIMKQSRFWHKWHARFILPVYENIEPSATNNLKCFIQSEPPPDQTATLIRLLEWKKNKPTLPEIDYYLSCTYLQMNRHDEFLAAANTFLFCGTDKQDVAMVLTRYYYAMVKLAKRDYAEAIKQTVQCIATYPTMAEFWCLLGDIFVALKQWMRASAFYDNAILFGSRRLESDTLPIEITKYKLYPEKMMKKCKEKMKEYSFVT